MAPSILQRIAEREAGAVRECIDAYGALVWSLARRLSKTPADAEDATQEIFLQIWRHADRYDASLGTERTFIGMIARRRLIDRLRKATSEPSMDSSVEALESLEWSGIDPSSATGSRLAIDQAMLALGSLRLEHRQVLELGILQGLSHPEIAKHLNMPLGSVKSNIRRGLICIRNYMKMNAIEDVGPPVVMTALNAAQKNAFGMLRLNEAAQGS